LAWLLGCALRRQELASLDVDGIEMREGRWVLPDLCGKGGRVRTVAIPLWVKHGIDAWMIAAKIEDGRLLRPLSKSGKLIGTELGDWAIWSVVEQSAKQIGIERFGAHDPGMPFALRLHPLGDLEFVAELKHDHLLLSHNGLDPAVFVLAIE
jgi:integrase